MKIGIDARIWSETTGRYVRNLIFELQKIDKKNKYYIFIQGLEKDEIEKKITAGNFTLVATDIKWHTIQEQMKLGKLIERYELDLMHFTYFSMPISYSKPFILTIHDLIIHHFPTGKASTLPSPLYYLKRFAYVYIVQKSADRARSIIAVSEATKKEIIDHLTVPSTKIKVIYEGVDEKLVIGSQKSPIKDPYILYVGNAYPHKNLNRLVEAFSMGRKDNQKLVLVGRENFFYKRLKKEVGDKKIEGLIFFGHATDAELASLYSNAKAYVMPSLMEGFGLPPLEAMANNCFVIASDIPSLREICQDCAMYFDPYNIGDIKEKIEFAFSTDDKRKFLEKGKERIKDFSWDQMAKETLKLYESSNSLRQS